MTKENEKESANGKPIYNNFSAIVAPESTEQTYNNVPKPEIPEKVPIYNNFANITAGENNNVNETTQQHSYVDLKSSSSQKNSQQRNNEENNSILNSFREKIGKNSVIQSGITKGNKIGMNVMEI